MTSYKKRMSIPGHFNKLQLIKLVRARPALWDKTEETYRHKFMKREAWHEICRIMKKDYDKLSGTERQKYYSLLVKVWRHTRTSWLRSLNARKKAKIFGTTVKPYIYDREMSFLLKVKRDTDDEDEEENEERAPNEEKNEESESDSIQVCDNDNEYNDDEWNTDSKEGIVTALNQEKTIEVTVERKDNTTEDLIDAKITAFRNQLQKNKNRNDVQEDRHFAFFKSVHPSLTSLDDDQVLEFQSGVINLLRNIKRGGFSYITNDQPCSGSSRGYYMQPEVPVVSQPPVVVPNVVQNIPSNSAVSQLRIVLDPLDTD